MDYSSEGYGSTVEKPKKKNYKIPIIIVIVVAVIAAILIYYAMSVAKTVTIEGDSLTPSNLSGYADDIADRFYVDGQNLTLYKDSTVQVESGTITGLNIDIVMQYGTVSEYWNLQQSDDGIKMSYKGELDDAQSYYTLSQLCAYLANIDDILNNELSIASYTVQFTACINAAAQTGGYMWNGEAFELLWADVTADCYPITVTTDGAQYVFYAV